MKLLVLACLLLLRQAFCINPQPPLGVVKSTIKIGLLIQDNNSVEARNGAEMAIAEANKSGGFNGREFELIVKSMEGPWGTGSKQAVNLIFEEKVWALLGLHDGRNAHLVEQAATKSQVVFLSAWSADPTLSQAFVPWFFNCVPNDNQQAASLTEEIYNKRKFNKVVIISGDDYDSKMTLNSYLNSSKLSGQPDPVQFNFDNYKDKLNTLIDKIREENADCLILFCQPSASIRIVKEIHQKEMKPSVFGSLTILNENLLSVKELREFDNILSIPSGEWTEPENLTFRMEFQNTYNKRFKIEN